MWTDILTFWSEHRICVSESIDTLVVATMLYAVCSMGWILYKEEKE